MHESQLLKLYKYCSMNKQCVKGIQNGKKAYLMRIDYITIWLYNSLAGSETTPSTVQRRDTEMLKRGGGFWDSYVTPYGPTLDMLIILRR